MKKIVLALLLVLSLTGMSYAIPLPTGPVTFHFTNWENRVTTAGDSLGGVFSLDDLLNSSSASVWSSGQGGEYLHGTFSGLNLASTDGTQFLFTGGSLNIYLSSNPLDPTNNGNTSAVDGSLWLSMNFTTGGDLLHPGDTLVSTTTGAGADPEHVLAVIGSGHALLDVTGGSAAAAFDSNTYPRLDGSGLFADAFLSNSFYIRNAPDVNPLLTGNKDGWAVWSKDPIGADVNVVPEPTTMLLFGIGAAGVAALRRKKSVA